MVTIRLNMAPVVLQQAYKAELIQLITCKQMTKCVMINPLRRCEPRVLSTVSHIGNVLLQTLTSAGKAKIAVNQH